MSPEKTKLLQLESTHQYVFHGSKEARNVLEPQQAYNYIQGKKVPDGEPAIFASALIDYAIPMALFNKENCPQGVSFSLGMHGESPETATLYVRISQKTLDQLSEKSVGYIHVFPRSPFSLRESGGVEYVSYAPQHPSHIIEVHKWDLTEKIEISDEL